MTKKSIDKIIQSIIDNELYFQSSKSSGKGGQNVNKRQTKVTVFFNIGSSTYLTNTQKQRLIHISGNFVYHHNTTLILTCQTERYQGVNKTKVLDHFRLFLTKALQEPTKRIPTTVLYTQKIVGRETKIAHSRKKEYRKKLLKKLFDT